MHFLLFGIIALFCFLLLLNWVATTEATALAKLVRRTGAGLLLLGGVLFLVRGQLSVAGILAAAAYWLWTGRWGFSLGRGARSSGQERKAASGHMSQEEACEILGVKSSASVTEIKEAHRRLLKKIHPDHGGSDYLAAKINLAKDTLLAGRK